MTVNADTKTETAVSHFYVIIAALCCIFAIAAALIVLFKILKKRRRREEKSPWPEIHGRINPFNEHLLRCKADPLVYIKKPKLMHTFNMKEGRKNEKAIHGIAVLKDMMYVVRDCCEEIEVYSMEDYKYKWSYKVEELASPDDIISHDAENSLFIEDIKDCKKEPKEIIRVMPKEYVPEDGKPSSVCLPAKCRWPIKDEKGPKIWIGRLSLTHYGNILIPLMNALRLREYDCDGNLKREIEIEQPDVTYKNIRQAILLRSGDLVLSFGDGATEEMQGVFIAKMEGQPLKCIQDDSHREAQKNIAKLVVTPLNKDNKNEHPDSEVKINLPSHTITLDDLSILVADRQNRRVLLFHVETTGDKSDTSKAVRPLTFQRELLSEKNGLNKPYRLYLDTERGFLFVSDNEETGVNDQKNAKNGRILVYSVI